MHLSMHNKRTFVSRLTWTPIPTWIFGKQNHARSLNPKSHSSYKNQLIFFFNLLHVMSSLCKKFHEILWCGVSRVALIICCINMFRWSFLDQGGITLEKNINHSYHSRYLLCISTHVFVACQNIEWNKIVYVL